MDAMPASTGVGTKIRLARGVTVVRDGADVGVGGPRQRAVLAMLADRPRRPVALSDVVDGVWGGRAPRTAHKTVRAYVSRLRSVLGAEHIRSVPAGYVLDVPDGAVDTAAFDGHVTHAREIAATRPDDAARVLAGALDDLGPVSTDELADCPSVALALRGLEERRLAAVELHMELRVACGRGPEAVDELESLTARHPHRERLWASLVRALYQAGRQVDALAAHRRVRRALAEDLGLEPGPELRELELAVLTHDPGLRAATGVPGVPRHLAGIPVHQGRTPATRYARTIDGLHIAYQVVGDGPVDLLFFGPPISHVELAWQQPSIARFYRGLSAFSRLIVFDKRGVGMSDPVAGAPTLEQRADDVRAVMDAAGSTSAVMLGTSDGGELGVLMATHHPERTAALALYSCFARVSRTDDYPIGVPPEIHELFLDLVEHDWGGQDFLRLVVPSIAADPEQAEPFATFARRAVSPGGAMEQFRRNFADDVRPLLPHVRVPTLVLHATAERFIVPDHGRYLAEHIAGARYVELPGADHLPYGDNADLAVEHVRRLAEQVHSARVPVPDAGQRPPNAS